MRWAQLLLVAASSLNVAACQELSRTYTSGPSVEEPIFTDEFNRSELGENWKITGGEVSIVDGGLVIENARNHPVWLRIPHPDAFMIDFDAWALSEAGDIKVEVAGDGHSVASSVNYVSSGYVVVFGGWDNRYDVIARLDEHGADRSERASATVEPGRKYHFRIMRLGQRLTWQLDGKTVMTYQDGEPISGIGHQSFAFGGWEAKVRFDNLEIRRLSSSDSSPAHD
jgi:hypothetical protein